MNDHDDDRVADQLAIRQLLATYTWALTDRDWSAWRAVFADDAQVDYSTAGGPVGAIDEAAGWIEASVGGLDKAVSHGGNEVITFTGDDTADVRSIYKMVMQIGTDEPTFLEACGWYLDTVARTAAGWRIASRVEHMAYVRSA
jgi:3-phenylpropionate/cinnamic acid dioxygenase small subunit